jgi:hypothetical protein
MGDWYDKLSSFLGLDAQRLDRILGKSIYELVDLPPTSDGSQVNIRVFRLPRGGSQIGFQILRPGEPWMGLVPCTEANLERLHTFLDRCREQRADGSAAMQGTRSVAAREPILRHHLGKDRLVSLERLPDRHLDVEIRLHLLVDDTDALLLGLTFISARGRLDVDLPWSDVVADDLEALLDVCERRP